MNTITTRAAEEAAWKLAEKPGGAKLLRTIREGFAEGRWSSEWKDSLGQPWNWTPGELYMWAKAHAMTCTDQVARVWVEVGEEPTRDRRRAENAAALAGMAQPFVAHLDMNQNGGDCDGYVEWTEPITCSLTTDGVDGTVDIPAYSGVPLEVGSSNPSTVYMHLMFSGAVARWAYGHERMLILIGAPHPRPWVLEKGATSILAAMCDLSDL